MHTIFMAHHPHIGDEPSVTQLLVDQSRFWSMLRVLLLSNHQNSDLLRWIQELPVPKEERVIQNLIYPSDTTCQ